jgi:hypothetical protein
MADAAARNARLDALVAATQAWATAQTTTINNQVTVLQNILTGRTGSASLPQSAVSTTSALVVNSISDFLTGGS